MDRRLGPCSIRSVKGGAGKFQKISSLPGNGDAQGEAAERGRRAGAGEAGEVEVVGAGGEGRGVDRQQERAEVVQRQAGRLEDRRSLLIAQRRTVDGEVGAAGLDPEGHPTRLARKGQRAHRYIGWATAQL